MAVHLNAARLLIVVNDFVIDETNKKSHSTFFFFWLLNRSIVRSGISETYQMLYNFVQTPEVQPLDGTTVEKLKKSCIVQMSFYQVLQIFSIRIRSVCSLMLFRVLATSNYKVTACRQVRMVWF